MSTRTLRILCCFLCVAVVPCAGLVAQEGGDHDRDRPGAPAVSGGLAGPGGPRKPGHGEQGKRRDTAVPQRNALQFGPVGRWWDDRSVVQAIGLRREQQKRMDDIFDANKPAILDSYKVFLKAQSNLAAVNKDPQASKNTLFAAIDAVNEARASLQKATSAMLLQIRREMDPDQINKLENIQ
jgi:Heavy-metal resistance